MRAQVELVLDAGAELGEGPLWDPRQNRLLWVDLLAGELHATDPSTGEDALWLEADRPVCAAGLRHGGGLVLAIEDGFAMLSDGSSVMEPLAAVLPPGSGLRFNDGACDARGCFWAGTMAYAETPGVAALHRLSPDGRVETMLEGVSISNGLAFASDGASAAYVDSPTGGVDRLVLDSASGGLLRRERLFTIAAGAGVPDGLAVDAAGGLWVALWGGGAVHRYTSEGVFDRRVEVPASNVTSCAFGGPGSAPCW